MGKLVLKLPDGRTRDIPLDRERITIGRRADNDVCLPFPAVSGEHAAVVTIHDDSFLEDLNSTNGTLVNGRPIAKHFLRDHDEIDIGRQVFVYVAGEFAAARGGAVGALTVAGAKAGVTPQGSAAKLPGTPARAPAAKDPAGEPRDPGDADPPRNADRRATTLDRRSAALPSSGSGRRVDTMPNAPDAEIAAPAGDADRTGNAGASDAGLPALEVLEGAGAGRVVPIDRDVFVIGRAGRQVAVAMRASDGLRLVHVEGDRPPLINGAALPEKGSLLALGDEIEIAGARLRFHPGR